MMDNLRKYIYGLLAGIMALAGFYFKGKSEGRKEEREKQNEKTIKDIQKVKLARNDVNKLKRVRAKYTRK